jgi:hypothetical protein
MLCIGLCECFWSSHAVGSIGTCNSKPAFRIADGVTSQLITPFLDVVGRKSNNVILDRIVAIYDPHNGIKTQLTDLNLSWTNRGNAAHSQPCHLLKARTPPFPHHQPSFPTHPPHPPTSQLSPSALLQKPKPPATPASPAPLQQDSRHLVQSLEQ